MKKIGIFCKQKPTVDPTIISQLSQWLESKNCTVFLEPDTAELIGKNSSTSKEDVASNSDLIICLGGDGTLLNVANIAHPHEVPILGVNLGSLGFLTETTMEDFYPTLEQVLEGKCEIENRMLLNAGVRRDGKKIEDFNVLNDIVINKGALARIVNLEVFVDNQYMTSYRADGLIISSPTGSTAYSLSAGGPIIHPSMGALVLSPICPFALTNRPVVIPDSSTITVQLTTRYDDEDVRITLDGQTGCSLKSGDILEAKKAEIPVKLVQAPGKDYYELLRKKLHWGATTENNP
ncbi:MAG: NAD(+)/NADH kinase [Nitrospinota bacterium]